MTNKSRVFVSSVMEGFGEYRAAARAAITAAGCEPVLVEDYPSLSASPRNACLDGVLSCDVAVIIVGERGGYRAPSGKLVVEEEYEHARGRSIHTLVFIQGGVHHDEDARKLVASLSAFVEGRFRRTFLDRNDLAHHVEEAVRALAGVRRHSGMDDSRLTHLLSKPAEFNSEAVLRVVIAPGRQNETVVKVERLDSEEFKYDFVRIGTDREVGLLDQNAEREFASGSSSVVVTQLGSGAPGKSVRIEMTEDGWLTIDANVTGRDMRARRDFAAEFTLYPIEVEEIAQRAAAALRFTDRVYAHIDEYSRYAGLLVNASLGSLNGKLVAYRRDRENLKGQMGGMFGSRSVGAPISFDRPEPISRAQVGWTSDLAQRIAGRLERRLRTDNAFQRG